MFFNSLKVHKIEIFFGFDFEICNISLLVIVKVGPPVHNYEHEAGSYGDGFT